MTRRDPIPRCKQGGKSGFRNAVAAGASGGKAAMRDFKIFPDDSGEEKEMQSVIFLARKIL